ncbi:VWA domain-containing protein [Thalassospira sp. TSL5-1]|uniref:vWA domain-containing protein n=1 Tax=Thalassospira sp. TSL5-1 TaxID=1544451 RepID=UPI0009396733|nr:VWA domain-containing protein [Thalassospira sp. TSL5-1]OKH86692.1 tellerium resistance protein TerY [Thalassospira sp. TSL5-1]
MRRLPVYLLLDTSTSMRGEAINAVRDGLDLLVSTLRQDPYALETAYLSVITFDTSASQVVPLTELTEFQAPDIDANGATSLGEALSLVADCIDREVHKSDMDTKGDWKPLVFLMTDGAPTDSWEKGLAAFKAAKPGLVVCCAAGPRADTKVLETISEIVVTLDTADGATIASFFKWVSASITTSSRKIDQNKNDVDGVDELPPTPAGVNLTKS